MRKIKCACWSIYGNREGKPQHLIGRAAGFFYNVSSPRDSIWCMCAGRQANPGVSPQKLGTANIIRVVPNSH